MTGKTHILGGVLAGELVCMAGGASMLSAPALLAGAVVGALLPDIDHRKSKISRSGTAGRVASLAVSAVTTHRGVVHTPAFILALGAVLGAASFVADHRPGPELLLGLMTGMLSHLVLDTLNPSGIMWLWPISRKRIHLASIRTNSLLEWVTATVLLALDVWLAASCLPQLTGEIGRIVG